jgi:hypothetical protein
MPNELAFEKLHAEDRQKWAGECNELRQIHAKLEKELETITQELSMFEKNDS